MRFIPFLGLSFLCLACSPIPVSGREIPSYPHIILERTSEVNRFGNPVLEVRMYERGILVDSVRAVSGRSWSQSRNRHVGGTKAPLPDGSYSVDPGVYHVNHNPELGSQFIEISPLFPTGRTHLGIHVDPSYNRDPKEDGTDGCIGIVNVTERDKLFQFISRTRTQKLIVNLEQ